MPHKFQISRDSQALYITIVTKDRLPVFQSDALKVIVCRALDEARRSGGFLLFAYVIMVDHLHLLTNQPKSSADVLRYIKGISARRVINYLKENNYQSSLTKLSHEGWKRGHDYSLWQQEKNVLSVFSEGVFMQKVNYIHMNPVRAGLVERAIDYRWSGARIWQGCASEDEPLMVDIDRIQYRRWRGHSPDKVLQPPEGQRPSAHQTAKPYQEQSCLSHLIYQSPPAACIYINAS